MSSSYMNTTSHTMYQWITCLAVMVCGYEYQDVCDAPVGKTLRHEREVGNIRNTLQLPLRTTKLLASAIEFSSLLMQLHVGKRNYEDM